MSEDGLNVNRNMCMNRYLNKILIQHITYVIYILNNLILLRKLKILYPESWILKNLNPENSLAAMKILCLWADNCKRFSFFVLTMRFNYLAIAFSFQSKEYLFELNKLHKQISSVTYFHMSAFEWPFVPVSTSNCVLPLAPQYQYQD